VYGQHGGKGVVYMLDFSALHKRQVRWQRSQRTSVQRPTEVYIYLVANRDRLQHRATECAAIVSPGCRPRRLARPSARPSAIAALARVCRPSDT
jgi:hypothetical protein